MRQLFFILFSTLFFSSVTFAATVPDAANSMSKQINKQLEELLKDNKMSKSEITISCTVPVVLDNFNQTSQLARQISEEMARYLSQDGYSVLEIRKGSEIVMKENQGEFLLTRDVKKLQENDANSVAVLTGTYSVTDKSVRFNMRLIYTATNEVLAMGTATVPMSNEIRQLLSDHTNSQVLMPSVQTKLK